jgi:hypothetical protein
MSVPCGGVSRQPGTLPSSRPPGFVRSGRARPAGRLGPEFAASLREGLCYLLTARTLLVLTAVQMVVNLCLSVEKPIIYDARETLGLSPPLVGVVLAAGGIGGLGRARRRSPGSLGGRNAPGTAGHRGGWRVCGRDRAGFFGRHPDRGESGCAGRGDPGQPHPAAATGAQGTPGPGDQYRSGAVPAGGPTGADRGGRGRGGPGW